MISFPNAKINLGLRVHKKRPDGFHEIESCFHPVQWNDILEVIESREERFTFSGLAIPGPQEDNLCWKAYKSIKKKYKIPPVHIHLHKIIPMGAGIGGGSSDAASTIRILNNLFSLNINNEEMEAIASELGSDCPFFIRNRTVMVSGRGTTLQGYDLNLTGRKIILVNPGIHISTKEAYEGIYIEVSKPDEVRDILRLPINEWKGVLVNDFEQFVFQKHTEIEMLKDRLYEAGAIYASMTGSGATVFGIFNEWVPLDFPENYTVWNGQL